MPRRFKIRQLEAKMGSEGKNKPIAIAVKDVWKDFKLFHERNPTLKETLLRGRRAAYETFWALRNVSFTIKTGQTVGIIGENGSGKSTLLKLLANILRPDKGSIVINGKLSALLELGAGFHPDLTGRENIFLNGSILGLTRQEISAKLDEIIAFSELEKFIDNPVRNYSSGMYVRLGFAVAINVQPDILLIDEILAVGDESFQRKCLDKLFELKEEGKTIIIVSHALDSVRQICDRALWLEDGVLKKDGKAPEVVDAYLERVNKEEQQKAGVVATFQTGSRWGTGEIEITGVSLLNQDGQPQEQFKTKEKLVIAIKYKTKKPIKKPVFGVAIYSREGLHINGTNTKFYNQVVDELSGTGKVFYEIEQLPLLKGSYVLSVAVYDYACLHAYDHHERCYSFKVVSGEVSDYGNFYIPAKWRYEQ